MASLLNEDPFWDLVGGKHAVGGKVYIGIVNLAVKANPKDIFSDRALSVSISQGQVIGLFGRPANKIWLSGRFSILVEDEDENVIYQELDNGTDESADISTLTNVQGTNTVTAEATETITAYVNLQMYTWITAGQNTAAVTVNIDSVGAKSLVKNHDQPLNSGDLESGQVVQMVFNETDDTFELISSTKDEETGNNSLTLYESLLIDRVNVTTMAVAADGIIVRDTRGNAFKMESVNLTIVITASGQNGLDTGSEASNTFYYMWAIRKDDGTTAGLFSASDTSPTLPSGFTYKGLLGAVFNDGSSDFLIINQRGSVVFRPAIEVLTNGTSTSQTAVSLSSAIPLRVYEVHGHVTVNPASAGTQAGASLYPIATGNTTGALQILISSSGDNDNIIPFRLTVSAQQTMGYSTNTGDEVDINIIGWSW